MEAQNCGWVRVGIRSQQPWLSSHYTPTAPTQRFCGMAWSGAETVHGSASLEQNDHCADTCMENKAITDSLKAEDKNPNVLIAC